MHIVTHYHCKLDLIRSKYTVGTFTDAALLLFLQVKQNKSLNAPVCKRICHAAHGAIYVISDLDCTIEPAKPT